MQYQYNTSIAFLWYVAICLLCTCFMSHERVFWWPVISGSPSQRANNVENVFMSWRHRVTFVLQQRQRGDDMFDLPGISAECLLYRTYSPTTTKTSKARITGPLSGTAACPHHAHGVLHRWSARKNNLVWEFIIMIYFLDTRGFNTLIPSQKVDSFQTIYPKP